MKLPFHIENCKTKGENEITATLRLAAGHEVFKGHFPGFPVMPGVLTLRIFREVLCVGLQAEAELMQSYNVRFTKVVQPGTIDQLEVRLQYFPESNGDIRVTGQVMCGEELVARADKLIYRKIS